MTTEQKQSRTFASFSEFYPYYLAEHRNIQCRRLHFIGTSMVIATILVAVVTAKFKLLLLLPILGYLPAWIGHFFFERNRPATFQYPFYSLLADFAMYRDILLNRVHI